MPYNSRANVVGLLAELYDTKSNVKLGGFRFHLQALHVSSHTKELWYNETVCLWMTIYTPPMRIEHSSEGIYGCHSYNALLFERIEHSGVRKGINVNNESYYLTPYNSRADVVRLLAERYDTKSNVKVGGFPS